MADMHARGWDTLTITGIECFGYHGVFADERREGQPFIVDLVIAVDTRTAAASDDLKDTVDYGSLVLAVKAAVERDPVDLVEKVGARIADVCLEVPLVEGVEVRLHKPQAPIPTAFGDVMLTIRRDRASGPRSDRPGLSEDRPETEIP
ncbi:MAG: dihydroneopterin aldolase [Nocardioides sp.]